MYIYIVSRGQTNATGGLRCFDGGLVSCHVRPRRRRQPEAIQAVEGAEAAECSSGGAGFVDHGWLLFAATDSGQAPKRRSLLPTGRAGSGEWGGGFGGLVWVGLEVPAESGR